MIELFYLILAAFLAYVIKGITGFGNTLVMGTLFSFILSNRITTPIDLLISLPTNAILVWRERKSISLQMVIPLAAMLLLGVIPGTLLLKTGQDWFLKAFLGLVIIGIALEMLLRKPNSQKKQLSWAWMAIIGFTSGILSGLYGIGALLVAYISRASHNRHEFRGNICCLFLIENCFRLLYYGSTGFFTPQVFLYTALIAPAVIIGMLAGIKMDSRLNESAVKRIVIFLLLLSGAVLFIKNILSQLML